MEKRHAERRAVHRSGERNSGMAASSAHYVDRGVGARVRSQYQG